MVKMPTMQKYNLGRGEKSNQIGPEAESISQETIILGSVGPMKA
jgi:hypothetical protein